MWHCTCDPSPWPWPAYLGLILLGISGPSGTADCPWKDCPQCHLRGAKSHRWMAGWICWVPSLISEAPESTQRKLRDGQHGPPCLQGGQSSCPRGSLPGPLGGPPGSALTAGLQCVQVPVLQPVSLHLCKLLPWSGLAHQGDPSGEGVLPLALSPQPSAFHPCFTLDLPVYVLQEAPTDPGGTARPVAAQAPGSTINLRDLQ